MKSVRVIRIVDPDNFAVLLYASFLGLVKTEKNAHECGLARSVLTEQRMYLALLKLKGNVVIRNDSGESFCDVQHFNYVIAHTP